MNRRDTGLDYLHNLSLGVIKRLTLTTFDIIRPEDKRLLTKLIDAFDFKAAGLQFAFTGRRVIRYVPRARQ